MYFYIPRHIPLSPSVALKFAQGLIFNNGRCIAVLTRNRGIFLLSINGCKDQQVDFDGAGQNYFTFEQLLVGLEAF